MSIDPVNLVVLSMGFPRPKDRMTLHMRIPLMLAYFLFYNATLLTNLSLSSVRQEKVRFSDHWSSLLLPDIP